MAAESKAKEEKFVVIDGKDLILGRLGSNISKRLLMGENIKIVNCKDVVILGRKKFLVERFKEKIFKNKVVKQGPYYSRSPADIVKRSFRNMLPYKSQRGAEAFKRLKCYNSVPSILANAEKTVVESAVMDANSVFYYTKVGDLCTSLGYTKNK